MHWGSFANSTSLYLKSDVLSQKGSSEFFLWGSKKRNKEPLVTSSIHCDCSFFTSMSFPCKNVFKVCGLVALPAFDESLVHKRWTMDFYFTTNSLNPALSIPLDHKVDRCVEYVPVHEEERSTLTKSQKFKKGLKIAQVLASLVSEGGMSRWKTIWSLTLFGKTLELMTMKSLSRS